MTVCSCSFIWRGYPMYERFKRSSRYRWLICVMVMLWSASPSFAESVVRELRVEGVGRAEAAPDRIEMSIRSSVMRPNYAEAMSASADDVAKIRAAVIKAGSASDDLRTSSFSVNAQYDTITIRKDGLHKQEFLGFRVDNEMSLGYALDMARLGATIEAIAESGSEPRIAISFTVSDPEPLRERALASAAASARKRAEVIAHASGADLGELLMIDGTNGAHLPQARVQFALEMADVANAKAAAPDIVPDDIEIVERLTYVWSIK